MLQNNSYTGIQFFLVEGLKDESLSGKVECLRRGLLLQLEGLRTIYPFLHFSPSVDPNANIRNTTTSLSYLNVESQNANSSLMSTSSSSSINYSSTGCSNGSSSTGYSGDGEVTSNNQNNSFSDKPIENYEDFEDLESCSELTTTTAQSIRSSTDFPATDYLEERDDEIYADIEPVSFRILVGKCDYHGVLSKRARSILPGVRNSKSFRCVLAGTHLYFYLKESDDKQKKVIDLNWYRLEEVPSDDNKVYSRRREFQFQLVCIRNKKTHTFFTTKKTSMERWIRSLRQAMSPSDPIVPLPQKTERKVEQNFSQNLDNENDEEFEDEEFYEELNADEIAERSSPKYAPNLWKPPPVAVPYSRAVQTQLQNKDISDYYSVPEEAVQQQKHIYYNQQRRVPPERPPLPNVLRNSLQRNRPLPQAPDSPRAEFESPDNAVDDEIYCEIDEEAKMDNNFRDSLSDFDTSSLSKEIFDTINKRVPSTKEKSFMLRHNTASAENYDVPSDSSSSPSWRLTHPPLLKAPSLPPKGTTSSSILEEESEYKVPVPASTVCLESLYNVPSNLPVPVHTVEEEHCGRYDNSISTDAISETASDKTMSDSVNNNQDNVNADLEACSEETMKANEDRDDKDINSVTSLKGKFSSTEVERQKTDEEPSNSVKDLIAKLNQTDDNLEASQKCYNSFRKSKVSLNGFENALLVECRNKIEVSRSVKSIKDNLEKENIKLKLSDARESNSLFKKEEIRVNGHFKGIESGCSQTGQVKSDLDKNNICSPQKNIVYIAKFAFVSNSAEGLSFNRGDEIVIKGPQSEDRLWKAVIKGREGFVPKEYLRMKE